MNKKIAAMDARQKALAKMLTEFRNQLLRQEENKKPDRQLEKLMKNFDGPLVALRQVAKKLKKYDYKLWYLVTDVIKSLQGDLTTAA